MSSTVSSSERSVIRSTRAAANSTSVPIGSRKNSWKSARPRPRGGARRKSPGPMPARRSVIRSGWPTRHACPSNSS